MRTRFNGKYSSGMGSGAGGDGIENSFSPGGVGSEFLDRPAPFSADEGMQSIEDTPGTLERTPPSEQEDDGTGPAISDRSFLVGHGSPALSYIRERVQLFDKEAAGLGAPGQEMGNEGIGAGMGQLPNALQDLPNDAADLDSGPDGNQHPQSTHDLSGAQQGTQYVPTTGVDGWYSA